MYRDLTQAPSTYDDRFDYMDPSSCALSNDFMTRRKVISTPGMRNHR